MSYRRLKWLAILAPILFVGVLEYARYAFAPMLDSWQGHLWMDGVVLIGAIFFYGAVFTLIDQMQQQLESQNHELTALRGAGLDISSELSLDAVLQKIVDQACNLIGTRYGALAVYDEHGGIRSFVTTGIGEEERARIGAMPSGKGLLGVAMREGQCLRMGEIGSDARSSGFPPNHPEMHSLLAVPVICRGPFRGNLYLSEKLDQQQFVLAEEETLKRFASQAAIAVDNAHLHAQVGSLAVVEERLRLAHEMHDGQAQVLAYVNTKAQAVEQLLKAGRTEEAHHHLADLAGAARQVYADVREGILGLRTLTDGEHDLSVAVRQHVEAWQDQSGIAVELSTDEVPIVTPDIELQLLRIVQESLANVRKHSGAEQARVAVENQREGIAIVIEDQGSGFDLAAPSRGPAPRFGLATMRERAEAIGAQLQVNSQPGTGTRVEVFYPLLRGSGSVDMAKGQLSP